MFWWRFQSTFGHHFVLQLVVSPIYELQIILFISKTGKAVRSGWLIALVHTNYYPNNRKQKQQHQLPHDILGVAENACPTEIKTAYRRLARLHVSKGYNISLYKTIVVEMLLLRRSRRVHCTYIDDCILTLSYQCPSATSNNELAPRQRRWS